MREAGRAGVPVAVHLRSESDELDSALQEMIDLAREAECKLHHSHLKCIGFSNRPLLDKTLALLEEHHIAFDSYPYASGSTTLASLLPPWLMNEGLEGAIEQLQQPAAFAELQALYAVLRRSRRVFRGIIYRDCWVGIISGWQLLRKVGRAG